MRGLKAHLLHVMIVLATAVASSHGQTPVAEGARFPLAESPSLEHQVLQSLLESPYWSRRALGAMRLERFNCAATRATLESLLRTDDAWEVRAFAVRSLARRGEREPDDHPWLANQDNPRVIRAALRYRATIEPDRLDRGVRLLARSESNDDRLLAAELGSLAPETQQDLHRLAHESLRSVIVRMNRVEAAAFSPRIAALLSEEDFRNIYEWQRWLQRTGRALGNEMRRLHRVPPDRSDLPPSIIAQLDTEIFARFEGYLTAASPTHIDIAFCLDCTGSMRPAFREAQASIDDTLIFLRHMSTSLRFSLMAYRDRGQEFETRGWDFTEDLAELRANLWMLTAEKGGGSSESVYAAMRRTLVDMQWRPGIGHVRKFLLIIGDGAPHVGEGTHCVDLAERARLEGGVMTHTVRARQDVNHFAEIAQAGHGSYVALDDLPLLLAEMLGVPRSAELDRAFVEFYFAFLELCR
ncbi:MAG TPA: VWA domain-containing protein [Phycisphaerales bacterium]|nr:VWA domain-containing protein [Phycisphaerales bacterium]HRQ76055.1 VWA domain-containing protein [Phycisphaerales bacterium]